MRLILVLVACSPAADLAGRNMTMPSAVTGRTSKRSSASAPSSLPKMPSASRKAQVCRPGFRRNSKKIATSATERDAQPRSREQSIRKRIRSPALMCRRPRHKLCVRGTAPRRICEGTITVRRVTGRSTPCRARAVRRPSGRIEVMDAATRRSSVVDAMMSGVKGHRPAVPAAARKNHGQH